MDVTPEFLLRAEIPRSQEIFRPISPSRRGEITAWACSAGVMLVLGMIFLQTGHLSLLALILLAGFAIAGSMISFGNWMDQNTQVNLSPEGLRFGSPLRKVSLGWGEVEELRAYPLGEGWRIEVIGRESRFRLRTGMEMRLGSSQAMPLGFPRGECLASMIIGGAGLAAIEREGQAWICRRPA